MRKFGRNSLLIFLLFSVLIHLSAWTTLTLTKPPDFLQKKAPVEIVILDQSPEAKRMQIVEQTEKPLNDEIPEDAKYLSANNQRVVKETKAQEIGEFRNTSGKGGPEASKPQQQAAQKNKTKSRVDNGQLPTLSDLRPSYDPSFTRDLAPATSGSGPASRTQDHIKDTPPSLETLLNTREFVYYTYYQRIRTQIRQFWEPSIRGKVKKIFAQGRSIASDHDHVTRVVITLNKEGSLVRVQVVGESGLKDLDDAAVEAFRAAEPFPNPPKGIVEHDGTIKINWDFILEAHLEAPPSTQRYARSGW